MLSLPQNLVLHTFCSPCSTFYSLESVLKVNASVFGQWDDVSALPFPFIKTSSVEAWIQRLTRCFLAVWASASSGPI